MVGQIEFLALIKAGPVMGLSLCKIRDTVDLRVSILIRSCEEVIAWNMRYI